MESTWYIRILLRSCLATYRISDQIGYFPSKLLFAGASTAEMLIIAIANLHLFLNSSHEVTPELEAIALVLTDAVPTFKLNTNAVSPKSSDTLTENSTQLTKPRERVTLVSHQLRPTERTLQKINENRFF